ncbi:MAG: lysophospholipid acyltransferase family protein [Tidjanibacter sp.]|nr:lysophospholipid acyltransferase family protein [Tidjanibacter sp.]
MNNLYGTEYTRPQRIGAWWLMAASKVIGWLPNWFLYHCLAPFIYFVMYRLVGYRKGVVRENLRTTFTEKSAEELLHIERKFYRHLAEIVVDTIDLASMSRKELLRRMEVVDLEAHLEATRDKDWVAAMGHYGSWEFFCVQALLDENATALGVYHPLKNKGFDLFYRRLRSRMMMEPVKMKGLIRRIMKARKEGERYVVGLIADQAPPKNHEVEHWYNFLDRPTAFYGGMEHISSKFGAQVYYVDIEKTKPGHYRCRFVQIYDGVEQVDSHEVIQRYADELSRTIRRAPEYWLWSHKRWKQQPTNV